MAPWMSVHMLTGSMLLWSSPPAIPTWMDFKAPSDIVTCGDVTMQSIYNLLTKMKLFKYFLATKMFRLWKAVVRHRLYNAVGTMDA